MTDIHIPAAALEAGAMAVIRYRNSARSDAGIARAAFEAMVGAWEGMHTHEWQRPWLGGMSGTDLILPLTENPDGE